MLRYFAVAFLAFFADLTGQWQAEVEVGGNSGGPAFVFKQAADGALTGSYEGQLGSAPVKGMVKGDDVEWSFQVEPQGEKVTVTYKGKIKADGTIAGSLSIPGLGEGTFTAKKR